MMGGRRGRAALGAVAACGALALVAARSRGTTSPVAVEEKIDPSVTLLPPQGKTRVVDFTTDEGTFLSLDVAPDGRWVVFDLLGALYRMSMAGGAATPLTENAGQSLNFHPAISPDGKRIAFISDRQGQNNVWLVDADGAHPRAVLLDRETRFMHPAWAPDGKSIVAVRVFPTPGRGWHRQTSELWRLPLDGSAPAKLLGSRLTHYDAPSFSHDGKQLYFHVSYSTGDGLGLLTAGHRLQRMDLASGRVVNVRTNEPTELSPEFIAALRSTGYASDNAVDPPAALNPVLSPDGRYVAFGLELKDSTMTYRGHEYAPRTALVVRELATGRERTVLDTAAKDLTMVNAQYGYGAFPGFGWTPDGTSLVAWSGGKIRRIDVASARNTVIPFQARVHRVLNEAARTHQRIADSTFDVKFIQWPAGSPDGRRLAFVALGRVWVMDLPNGVPRPVALSTALQLTPSWSPDGKRLAFATWDDSARGGVWTIDANGNEPTRVTTARAEFIHPRFTDDGKAIVVSRGPGERADAWNGWGATNGWKLVRVSLDGSPEREIAELSGPHAAQPLLDGRVAFQFQERANEAARLLYLPFPTDEALSLGIRVRSISTAGGETRDVARFPARRGNGSEPVLSPNGRWLGFQSGRFIYVVPTPSNGGAVDTDPNREALERVRVFDGGGVYASWRDENTLQFASGAKYVTYDASTGKRSVTTIGVRAPRAGSTKTIAFTNARVITSDGERVIESGTVVVRGSRIACVGTSAECVASGVDTTIDARGKTIVPGFMDLHAHHTGVAGGVVTEHRSTAALDLAYGVTTILDPSTESEDAFPLAEMTEAGLVTGPRTFSTAEIVIHPGVAWGDQQIIRTQADADREIDRRADWGAVSIKNYRQAGRWQQQMILRAARRRGITVTSEGGPLYFDIGQILDGQPGWEHLLANLPVYRDATEFFGRAGAVYSPTSIVAGHVFGSEFWFRGREHLDQDAKYRRFMPAAELRARLAGAREYPKSAFSFPIIAEGLADIMRAGGRGVLGEHGEQPGIGTHWEMWAYAEALKPAEVLRAATIDGAWFIGLENELGSLTTGKIADLVVLNANPLENIRNTANIAMVMKAGRLFDAGTLNELWPQRRAYGPIPWSGVTP